MSVWFQMQRDGREAKIARRIGRAKTWNRGQLNKVQAGCQLERMGPEEIRRQVVFGSKQIRAGVSIWLFLNSTHMSMYSFVNMLINSLI